MKNDNPPKVLYVDDEETNLFIFRELFKKHFEIYTSDLPIEALNLLDSVEIDAMITDMRMPQMDGVELVKLAKEKHDNIPYFMLTAFENNDEINQAIEDSLITRCFIKPIDVEEINKEISRAVAG